MAGTPQRSGADRFKHVVVDTRREGRYGRGRPYPGTRTTRGKPRKRSIQKARPSLEARAVQECLKGSGRQRNTVYVPDSVLDTVDGKRIVHLQQQFLGVPVYDGRRAVLFDARRKVVGALKSPPLRAPRYLRTQPRYSAADAVLLAARYLAEDSNGALYPAEVPVVVCQFAGTARATAFRMPPFRKVVTASLTLLPRPRDVRLAWVAHFILPLPGEEYEVLVSADDPKSPEVLLCRRTTACAASGKVFKAGFDPNGNQPLSCDFPLPTGAYPGFSSDIPNAFPWPWVDGDTTSGNNVVCWKGYQEKPFRGTATPQGVEFVAADTSGMDQRLLNAFYVCNLMHDLFYFLGFDEARGNFQTRNLTGGGQGNDRVQVLVHDSTDVRGTANFRSRVDGNPAEMNLGLLGDRHAALDAGVVIHEYVHGVTSRLIGGLRYDDPLSGVGKKQSAAMGEGYSDYFAITILNYFRRHEGLAESFVFGAWLAQNGATGWRPKAYDNTFSLGYDTLRNQGNMDPHDAGQVWCYALLGLQAAFRARGVPPDEADRASWRIVLDSLPQCRVGADAPHFLDGKKALLEAYDAMAAKGQVPGSVAAQRADIVARFNTLGMSSAARSDSADFGPGIHPDFGS